MAVTLLSISLSGALFRKGSEQAAPTGRELLRGHGLLAALPWARLILECSHLPTSVVQLTNLVGRGVQLQLLQK